MFFERNVPLKHTIQKRSSRGDSRGGLVICALTIQEIEAVHIEFFIWSILFSPRTFSFFHFTIDYYKQPPFTAHVYLAHSAITVHLPPTLIIYSTEIPHSPNFQRVCI